MRFLPTNGPSTSRTIAILDANILLALVNTTDRHHAAAAAVLGRRDLRFVLPALVVAEALYLIGTRFGPRAEAAFVRGLAELDVEAPAPGDWARMAELVEQYADFPLGGTDASIVALAERLGAETIVTLDRRHFGTVRPRHCASFRILPD